MSVLRQLLTRSTLWIALLVVISAEWALRFGLNEWFVIPDSYAGQTIRKTMALRHIDPNRPTLATLGSSIAVYGLNHERVAETARARGANHVNLSTPGAQLLALRAWASWLPKHVPARGGIIVIGPDDYKTVHNGNYELNIGMPLLRQPLALHALDTDLVATHVPGVRAQLDTWGQFSLLFGYRSDFANALGNPVERARKLMWWFRNQSGTGFLELRVSDAMDVCALDLSSPAACLAMKRPSSYPEAEFVQVQRDCANIAERMHESQRPSAVSAAQLQLVRDLRRQAIIDLGWQGHTLLLRLPLHPIWQYADASNAPQLRDALHAQPVAEGLASEVNLEHFFSARGVAVCSVFRDLWHLNAKGQAMVTDAIAPAVDQLHQ
jgi:hypothetical protein